MTRPAGPLPVLATDATYTAPGKTWNGQPTKVSPTSDELTQGFEPSRVLPAPKQNWLLNAVDRWLSYLDGIEAKNWDAGAALAAPSGPVGLGVGTTKTLLLTGFGVSSYEAGGAGTGFTFGTGFAFAGPHWTGHKSDDGGTASTVLFPLDLPDGTIVTGFSAKIVGLSGHSNTTPPLVQHMPEVRLIAEDANGTGVTLPGATGAVDPTTVLATYKAHHNVGVSGTTIPLDCTANKYWIAVEDEWGTNSVDPSINVISASVTIRDTPAVTVYASPGTLYLPDYARHSIAWNSVRELFVSVIVRDHVTTPLSSTSGSVWSTIATGLSSPTRSTVNLTFTATGDGGVNAGDPFSDGSHVWTLNADHTWSGSGSKGPFAATIYSPGTPAYYGPIAAPAGSITTILNPSTYISAVTNASDATLGVDGLGGDGSSVAVDGLGGELYNTTGHAFYRFGPNATTPASNGLWFPIDAGLGSIFDLTYAAGAGVFLLAGKDISGSLSGLNCPILEVFAPTNSDVVTGGIYLTLPNAAAYTVDTAFVAGSSNVFAAIYTSGSDSNLWTGDGATFLERGAMTIDGIVVALEWSDTDRYFVLLTNTGHAYTSTDGITWDEPTGAAVASSFSHLALVGGSWLAVGIDEQQQFFWSGDQGRSWSKAPVPWEGGFLLSLVALNGCFAAHHVAADGTATLYRSLRV